MPKAFWIAALVPAIALILSQMLTLLFNHLDKGLQRRHELEMAKSNRDREDRMAATPQRIEAYGAFCDAAEDASAGIVGVLHQAPVGEDVLAEQRVILTKSLMRLQIVASLEVGDSAERYVGALVTWASTGPAAQEAAGLARVEFVREMRGEMQWSRHGDPTRNVPKSP